MGLNCIVAICKIFPFKQIEKHSRIIEYYEAFKELFKPFLHSRFRQFVLNCLELKMRRFIFIIETFYKYKAMNRLFVYCERDFKTEIINFLINVIKKPFINYFFYKIKLNKKEVQNNNKNKINISFSNILINQIINQNETKIENNNEEKTEINLKENPLIEEVLNDEENNIFNSSSDYYSLSHRQSNNMHSIKPMKKDEEINTHISIKDLIISDNNNKNNNNNNLKKLAEIQNPEEFSDIMTNMIIENLIKTEIKPFSPSELVARVDAIYRRVSLIPGESSDSSEIVSGPFVLNLKSRTLLKNGEPIELTQVEFQIMENFLRNPNVALERVDILSSVWGENYYGDVKIVDVNVRRLRMKIEDEPSAPKYLLTVWGFGYKWDANAG